MQPETGWVGLVHASPVHARWQDLEEWVHGDEDLSHLTRARALWIRLRHGYVQRELGETGHEHMGPVEGVQDAIEQGGLFVNIVEALREERRTRSGDHA